MQAWGLGGLRCAAQQLNGTAASFCFVQDPGCPHAPCRRWCLRWAASASSSSTASHDATGCWANVGPLYHVTRYRTAAGMSDLLAYQVCHSIATPAARFLVNCLAEPYAAVWLQWHRSGGSVITVKPVWVERDVWVNRKNPRMNRVLECMQDVCV